MWNLHCRLFMCPKMVLYAIFVWTNRCVVVKFIHFVLWSCWTWTINLLSVGYLYSLSRSALVTHFDLVSYSIWYTEHSKQNTWDLLFRTCHQVFLKFVYHTHFNINNLEEDWFSFLIVSHWWDRCGDIVVLSK